MKAPATAFANLLLNVAIYRKSGGVETAKAVRDSVLACQKELDGTGAHAAMISAAVLYFQGINHPLGLTLTFDRRLPDKLEAILDGFDAEVRPLIE